MKQDRPCGSVTTLVPEVACRPASTEEILKKHVLELRPSRRRRRQLLAEEDDEDEEERKTIYPSKMMEMKLED